MRGGRPPLRVILALAALSLVIAAVAVVGLVRASSADGETAEQVQAAQPALRAPATAGHDADGRPVRLPSPSGRPAMVTFLFTECPDVCPLVASQIAAALDLAGPAADGIDVVAISVDPAGDTPAAVRRFLARHRLQERMRYMVGDRAELQPVWDAWGVAAQPAGPPGAGHHAGEGHERRSIHSAPIIFIDPSGTQVARYAPGVPYTPAELAAEIRALAA